MLKTIIFDWDGTLANSIDSIIACKRILAEKYQLALDEAAIKAVIGLPFQQALAASYPTATAQQLQDIAGEFHYLIRQPEFETQVFPQVKALLVHLKSQKLNLAIATAKAKLELIAALRYNQLDSIFDVICCGDEYPGKPDPYMLNHIMDTLDCKRDECLMVGDTITDIAFAKNAKVKVACVTFGAHDINQLTAAQPDYLLEEWNQFNILLKQLCF